MSIFLQALLASVTAGSFGCAGPAQLPVQPLPEADALRSSSGFTMRERLVIRDASTWSTVWPQIVGSHRPIPTVPEIDFTSDVVVVAAMGTQPTGGYVIEVEGARLQGDVATISVLEQSPAEGCAFSTSQTMPVAVVLMPTFRGKATFVERTSQPFCQ